MTTEGPDPREPAAAKPPSTRSNPDASSVAETEAALPPVHVLAAPTLPLLIASTAYDATRPEVPGHEVGDHLGAGGMGTVYAGRDHALNRDVAVKVLHPRHRDRADLMRRFVEEAQVASQLQHPGVPPVHGLGGLPDGRPFFTMKLVKGRTLADLLKQRSKPTEDLPHFLQVLEQVCQTVAYAHSKRVLHRDLKPANVMVGAFGEVQVMDWGLAKVLPETATAETNEAPQAVSVVETVRSQDSDSNTQAGSVLGTFAYMPPEQARGDVERIDPRSDVFGLGAILCEILTGQPPYTGSSEKVRREAQRGDLLPARERLAACGADADLVSLALVCLSSEPAQRPADGAAVAAAMAAYQASVQKRLQAAEVERAAAAARADGALAREAVERRAWRVTVGLLGAVVIILLTGTLTTLAYYLAARDHAQNAATEAERARLRADEARRNLYASQINLAQQAWKAPDEERLIELLQGLKPQEGERDLRGFEWHYLWRRCHPWVVLTEQSTYYTRQFAFSPDGNLLAIAGPEATITLIDTATGAPLRALPGAPGGGSILAFSPGGRYLAAGGGNALQLQVWRVADGQLAFSGRGNVNAPKWRMFSDDDRFLAWYPKNSNVQVVDLAIGKAVCTCGGDRNGFVNELALSPDGKRLAAYYTGDTDNLVVWDVPTGKMLLQKTIADNALIAFSPEGRRLAVGTGALDVWDLEKGTPVYGEAKAAAVDPSAFLTTGLAWSADGDRIAMAEVQRTEKGKNKRAPEIRVCDASTGHLEQALPISGEPVRFLGFSQDRNYLLSLSARDRLPGGVVWDLATGRPKQVWSGWRGELAHVAFGRDGVPVAWHLFGKTVTIETTGGDEFAFAKSAGAGTSQIIFSPDGGRIASLNDSAGWAIWDTTSGKQVLSLPQAKFGAIQAMAFSADGTRFITGTWDGKFQPGPPVELKSWQTSSGEPVGALHGPPDGIVSVACSPDGAWIAAGGLAGVIHLWDARTGAELPGLKGHTSYVASLAFGPDGRYLVSGSADDTVKVWDLMQRAEVASFVADAVVVDAVACSTDGRFFAHPTAVHGVIVRELVTGKVSHELRAGNLQGAIKSLAFSPDGSRVSASTQSGVLIVWDLGSEQPVLSLKGCWGASFSPDGKKLVTHDGQGMIALEAELPGPEVVRQRAAVRRLQPEN
jgi:WD40 repeat protein/tRNA A-37 threonylcarbamoyl transferase component Bud32